MATKAKKSPAKRSGGGKGGSSRLMRVSVLIAVALLLLFSVFLTVSMLLFSPYRRLGVPQLGVQHFQTLKKISEQVAGKTFSRNAPEEAKLRLSPSEVNVLLELAGNASTLGVRNAPPPGSFALSYRPDGAFVFTFPLETAPEWFFGGKLYADGVFFLEKQEDKLIFDMPKLKFGRAGIPLPGSGVWCDPAGNRMIRDMLPPEFNAAIKSFYPERDGTLVLVYRPAKLLPLLFSLTM